MRVHGCAMLTAATLGLLMTTLATDAAAAARAQVDRTTVQDGDTVTLTIESDQPALDMRPDVGPLNKDFDVVGTSTNRETRFINGTRSDRTRWEVRLQPRHTGVLDIPPITVGGESTAPLKLTVTVPSPQAAGLPSGHVFVEVEAPNPDKAIYVQQQVPYTVRLYYDDSVVKGELAPPDPADAIVEQLGAENRSTAVRDGHGYNVVERHYAIAPKKAESFAFPPRSFAAAPSRRRAEPMAMGRTRIPCSAGCAGPLLRMIHSFDADLVRPWAWAAQNIPYLPAARRSGSTCSHVRRLRAATGCRPSRSRCTTAGRTTFRISKWANL